MYGIMMVIGMAAAIGIIAIQSKRFNFPSQDAVLTGLIAIAGGIAGAVLVRPVTKIPEVIINWGFFSKLPLADFLGWFFGGLMFYGGVIGGVIAGFIYCRKFGISLVYITDIFAPAIPIGHAFGRVGCFLAGCCYGVETSHSHPFAVIYPPRTDGYEALAAPAGIPLLATPLIEVGGNIIIACILLFKPKHKVTGRDISLYGIMYSIQRFVLEFYRGDAGRGIYWGISTSQIISVVILLASVFWFFYVPRLQKPRAAEL